MALGTGVFLGLALCAVIYLFLNTKSEWNWKKIIIWLLSLVLISISVLAILLFKDSLFLMSEEKKNHSGIISSYGGVKIGDKLPDIQFKFGKLEEIKPTKNNDDTSIYWIDKEFLVFVSNKSNKVDYIVALCDKGVIAKFNGIGCGDTGELLEKTFGNNLKIQCNTDGDSFRRAYVVPKYSTEYYLEKNKVESILFYGDERKSTWSDCK